MPEVVHKWATRVADRRRDPDDEAMDEPIWSTSGLLGAGARERALQASNALHRLRRGRFVSSEAWEDRDEFERHQMLIQDVAGSAPKSVVLSHVSAAVQHGLELPDGLDLSRVHLTWPGSAGRRGTTNIHPYRAEIAPPDITTVDGIQTTTIARTIFDLARTGEGMTAVSAADSALRQGVCTREAFADIILRMRRRRGVAIAEDVMSFADPDSAGPPQSQTRLLFARLGLPRPRLNPTVQHPFIGEIGLDFEFEQCKSYVCCAPDAMNGRSLARAPLTELVRDLGRQIYWISPADLDEPARVLARLNRIFTIAGYRRWPRQPPILW